MQKLTVNGSWIQFLKAMRDRESFKTHGSLRGEAFPNGTNHVFSGMLDHSERMVLKADEKAGIDYVVYSYSTPIAWHVMGSGKCWHEVDQKFSVTTSKHQGRIFPGTSMMSDDILHGTHIASTY